jgi:citrate lyase subunit beta / citryl-CoA lyase
MEALLRKLAAARTFLIFPGDEERKRERALTSAADAVVLDLEDGVAAEAKDEARAAVGPFVEAAGVPARLVRVNDPLSEDGARDLAAVAGLGVPVGVLVPKATPQAVDRAAELERPLVALVEDAAGIRDAHALAEHSAVFALALGSADLTASLGLVPDGSGSELLFARSQLVVASGAARIRPPIDGPCLDVHDPAALEREVAAARTLGLRGKICIHPTQVEGVRRGFAPTAEELEQARRVVAAWAAIVAEGNAVGVVDGMLVDPPVAERARAVIEASEGSGTA